MNHDERPRRNEIASLPRFAFCLLLSALALIPTLAAQSGSDSAASTSALPDAPDPVSAGASDANFQNANPPRAVNPKLRMASPYDKYIDPGQAAPRLTAKDKVVLGFRDAVSPVSVGAWLVNAGYEQAVDGKPHWGGGGGAFADRFGSAAVRDVSEDVFDESILAPILREDPRYYIMGSGHRPLHRFLYAASRVLITRKDDGGRTINFAELGGNAGGAVLTQLYYPQVDRSVKDIGQIFGGSVGGSALGFVISEFFSSSYERFHLKHASTQ